jgi:hypothetical protein
MAHFAQLDENNKVIQVLVVNDDYLKDENGNEVEELGKSHMESVHGGKWIQTSYNHNTRVRYAGTGYTYDETLDAFLPPKPYESWILNEKTADWEAPVPEPTDAPEGSYYQWNEEEQSWELITPPTE